MCKKYFLIIRTGESEIKAIENTKPEIFETTFPIIEITRGRKKQIGNTTTYPFTKRLEKIKECLKGKDVGFDVTGKLELSSPETMHLFNPDNGYKTWIDFIQNLKNEDIFKSITPTIIFNFEDQNFEENIRNEIKSLENISNRIIYRSPINDEDCYDDLELIYSIIKETTELIVIIDCEYIPQAMQKNISDKCTARINNIREMRDDVRIAICGTSFPNRVTDIGDVNHDTFSNAEVLAYKDCASKVDNVIYGDYGSVNPTRNDTIKMARGWIPRIDIPLKEETFYYKQRRPKGMTTYAPTYKDVADRVVKDERFPHIEKNWGLKQVLDCTKMAPSSRPGFWISVRMCIHIEQQYIRINQSE